MGFGLECAGGVCIWALCGLRAFRCLCFVWVVLFYLGVGVLGVWVFGYVRVYFLVGWLCLSVLTVWNLFVGLGWGLFLPLFVPVGVFVLGVLGLLCAFCLPGFGFIFFGVDPLRGFGGVLVGFGWFLVGLFGVWRMWHLSVCVCFGFCWLVVWGLFEFWFLLHLWTLAFLWGGGVLSCVTVFALVVSVLGFNFVS